MDLSFFSDNSQAILALCAAVAVFSAIVVVGWPYLARDELGNRMRQISSERERIRARERAKLVEAQKKQASLRTEPKKFFKDIVDRFNLARQTDDGSMVKMLRQAGYRGQNPVFVYLSLRLMLPAAMFIIAGLYVFVILQLDRPFFFKLAIVSVIAAAAYYLPLLYVRNQINKRQTSVRRAWPDGLDLMLICVESGMGIEGAFRKVSEEIGAQSIPLAEEMSLTTAELSYLQDRRKAYENLSERTGLEGVRSVVTALIQAEKYGTPIGTALRVLAQENRDMRMSEAEKKAAALPPKLTVPMILFFLPVLFAVIITPAIIQVVAIQ